MESKIYNTPRHFFKVSLPLVRNEHLKRRPLFISKSSLGYFGCSKGTNTTRTLFVFGWALCRWERHEWHDESDKERAERYLSEWSKCENELRGLRLLHMGEAYPDPETRKLLRDSLGINLDEGTA